MKILVIGSSGFLGNYIVPALKRDHNVIGVDRTEIDICLFDSVRQLIGDTKPDLVLNLAALCGAIPSVQNPHKFYETNGMAALSVMEACREFNIERMIFTSSLTVFGQGENGVTEDSPFNPRHPYAVAKIWAEQGLKSYCSIYGMSCMILRPTLVVGEHFKEPHAVGDFLQTALSNGTIEIFGAGKHQRDFIHPDDVASACTVAARFMEQKDPGYFDSFNLSNNEPIRIVELAEKIVRVVSKGTIQFKPTTKQAFSLYTKIDKAQSILNWSPQVNLDTIIQRLQTFLNAKPSEKL